MSAIATSTLACTTRRVRHEDCDTLFGWRNTPWLIELGASRRVVPYGEHQQWFAESLTSQKRELFIVEVLGAPVGMIRFDLLDANDAEVSIYLMPPYQGRGYGRQAFLASAPDFMMRRGISRIIARVLPQNARSARFFENLEFRQASFDDTLGYLFILDREIAVYPGSS